MRYALGVKGVEFTGILQNIDIPTEPEYQDLRNNMEIFVIFWTPKGKKITKEGTLEDDNADLTDGAYIFWTDDDATQPSLLNETGYWEYTVAVSFTNGKYIESPYRHSFWVT